MISACLWELCRINTEKMINFLRNNSAVFLYDVFGKRG